MNRNVLLIGLLCLWSVSDASDFREPELVEASEQDSAGDLDVADAPDLPADAQEEVKKVQAVFAGKTRVDVNETFSVSGVSFGDRGVNKFTKWWFYPIYYHHNGRHCCDVQVSSYMKPGEVFFDYTIKKWCRHYNWWYHIPRTHCSCDEGCANRYVYSWSNVIRPQACRPVAWTWRYSWAYCYWPKPYQWRRYWHYIITKCDCRYAI